VAEDRLDRRVTDLAGKPVEVAKPFGGISTSNTRPFLDLVAQGDGVAGGRVPA
jgi:hypothetical protein